MLNPIWLWLVLLAFLIGGFSGKLPEITSAAFSSANTAVMTIALPLVGVMAIWLGIMRLAELSGLVNVLARVVRPVTRRLFPEVPAEHPAMGAITMNIAANMLGLGNAATPLGLRAMKDLETLNPRPGVATNAMCMFLAINTSSVQLIPTTAVAILAAAKSKNPTAIIGSAFLATLCSTAVGILAAKLLEKLPRYRLEPAAAEAGVGAGSGEGKMEAASGSAETTAPSLPSPAPVSAMGRVMLWTYWLSMVAMFFALAFPDRASELSTAAGLPAFAPMSEEIARHGFWGRLVLTVSLMAVPIMLSFFPLYAWLRGVKVYEEFVEGAKEGFGVATRIIPFLVAILVAMGMFRAAGGIDLLARLLGPVLALIGFPIDLLGLVLVRPLSGGATTGMFTDIVARFGPDDIRSLMAGTIFGSTETTFYVIAVYFGSVSVRRTRHAVPAGLLADLAGVIASVVICRAMFG